MGGSGTSRRAVLQEIGTLLLVNKMAKRKAQEAVSHCISEMVALDGLPLSTAEDMQQCCPMVFYSLTEN